MKIPNGISNGTFTTAGNILPNVRRAIFCGRDSAVLALGRGFSDGKEVVPGFIIREDVIDIAQTRRVAISAIWGIKKIQFNGIDHGVIVCPTDVAQTS